MNFEWDPRKGALNERKHSISFDEAMTVFADWESITIGGSRVAVLPPS